MYQKKLPREVLLEYFVHYTKNFSISRFIISKFGCILKIAFGQILYTYKHQKIVHYVISTRKYALMVIIAIRKLLQNIIAVNIF